MRPLRTLVLALAVLSAVPALVAPAVAVAADKKEPSPEERYELGLKYMKRGYYTKALEEFNRVRNYHRDDPVSVKAELAIADVYYKKGEWEQARLAYADFARLHPRHQDLDYVVYRIGMCLYKRAPHIAQRDQTTTRQAVDMWTGFAERFPDSKHKDEVADLAGKCKDRLALKELEIARFYEKRAKARVGPGALGAAWFAARRRAEEGAAKYPDSKYEPEMLAMAGTAYHQWGMETEAHAIRDQLAAEHPDSSWLRDLDHELAKPAGSPPVEQTFPRPYRVPTASGPAVGAGSAGAAGMGGM